MITVAATLLPYKAFSTDGNVYQYPSPDKTPANKARSMTPGVNLK